MTLERAVEILNRENHRGGQWYIRDPGNMPVVNGPDYYDWFEPFEAIAIAEKYEREKLSACRELQHIKTVEIGRGATASLVGGVITRITLKR